MSPGSGSRHSTGLPGTAQASPRSVSRALPADHRYPAVAPPGHHLAADRDLPRLLIADMLTAGVTEAMTSRLRRTQPGSHCGIVDTVSGGKPAQGGPPGPDHRARRRSSARRTKAPNRTRRCQVTGIPWSRSPDSAAPAPPDQRAHGVRAIDAIHDPPAGRPWLPTR